MFKLEILPNQKFQKFTCGSYDKMLLKKLSLKFLAKNENF